MLRAISQVELRNLARDRALWLMLAAFVLLVGYASASGARFVQLEREAIAALQHAGGERPDRRAASLPPAPLAGVSVGQRDLLPHTIEVTTDARLHDASRDQGKSAGQLATGPFDLAFVFVFLLPLLVIALGYDLLSGERERGTLAMVLSQPISPARFVLTKACVRGAVVAALLLVPGLLGPLFASGGAGLRALPEFALYAALLASYTIFWFAAAACVNAFGRSSAGNALALVALWLGLVVVVPGLASVAADTLYPSPSRVALVNAARAAASEAEDRASAVEGDHGEGGATAQARHRARQAQDDIARTLQPLVSAFDEQLARKQRLVDALRFLSPAIVLYEGLNDVAGSGVRRHQHFIEQVRRFHAEHRRFFGQREHHAGGSARSAEGHAHAPRFEYEEPGAGALAQRAAGGLLGLLVPSALLIAFAVAGLRRTLNHGLR